jgi:hypothetical protein
MNTIKQRIRQALLDALNPLKTEGLVRLVERRRDLVATSAIRPALLIIEGGELEIARDVTGQTYAFDVFIKVLAPRTRDGAELKDELVARVQQQMENLSTLSGLASYVHGGEEKISMTARFVFIDGPFVRFRLSYERKVAQPEETY